MNIPNKLKIGGHTYTVVLKEMEDCGRWDNEKMEIAINSKMGKTMQESSLLHEIIHAMNSTLSEGHTGHALQDSLSEQLYQVLKDNKLLK